MTGILHTLKTDHIISECRSPSRFGCAALSPNHTSEPCHGNCAKGRHAVWDWWEIERHTHKIKIIGAFELQIQTLLVVGIMILSIVLPITSKQQKSGVAVRFPFSNITSNPCANHTHMPGFGVCTGYIRMSTLDQLKPLTDWQWDPKPQQFQLKAILRTFTNQG